jgi:hypothetical protein
MRAAHDRNVHDYSALSSAAAEVSPPLHPYELPASLTHTVSGRGEDLSSGITREVSAPSSSETTLQNGHNSSYGQSTSTISLLAPSPTLIPLSSPSSSTSASSSSSPRLPVDQATAMRYPAEKGRTSSARAPPRPLPLTPRAGEADEPRDAPPGA